jgi:hypothetical protein
MFFFIIILEMRKIIENDKDREHPTIVVFNQNRKHDRFIQYQAFGRTITKDIFDLSKMTSYTFKNKK